MAHSPFRDAIPHLHRGQVPHAPTRSGYQPCPVLAPPVWEDVTLYHLPHLGPKVLELVHSREGNRLCLGNWNNGHSTLSPPFLSIDSPEVIEAVLFNLFRVLAFPLVLYGRHGSRPSARNRSTRARMLTPSLCGFSNGSTDPSRPVRSGIPRFSNAVSASGMSNMDVYVV